MKNTTLCYIERDGSYLMLHRVKKAGDENQGKWIGVGGKFEPKESPEECLLREVREETGLTLTRYRLRGIVTFVSDRYETEYMYLFTADAFEGTLTDTEEGGAALGGQGRGAVPAPLGRGQALSGAAGGGCAVFLPEAGVSGGHADGGGPERQRHRCRGTGRLGSL